MVSFVAHLLRGLGNCARSFEESGLTARSIRSRAQLAKQYRARHLLCTRDTDDVSKTDHKCSEDYTLSTSESGDLRYHQRAVSRRASSCLKSTIGEMKIIVCVLNPQGETDQAGVPVVLDLQFVDVSTCQPIEGIYAETWNCNATGVYSGAQGNGNGNSEDDSILQETFLRRVSKTGEEGVVTFNTLFPGHYAGRATHYHVLAHLDAALLENNTLTGGSVPHIGQLFFDQDLITAVEVTSPYSSNTVEITKNTEDSPGEYREYSSRFFVSTAQQGCCSRHS
ncbi:intradiol ring-cleavage dioxygenase [Aspergillus nidulans FGSC A4]|uniref:Intradiol ring-cleavage dioxygenases domain-containing protein n=1 Tax=Emericella nidulans (strain FGSC A4 / ATCC 38163 / CBS 112.46 / NRRL 194 / M139) TaxID=227321 RepID=C8VQB3_EMENI|nr:hypothetical protein [Aspergillus nidulans FGSC A4]CBF87292.1 TPA: conserved hypothetical protein [Aspergillus nidulans FGSC A4]